VARSRQLEPKALSITVNSILVRDPELVAADLDDGVVILSVRAGCYFDLNAVASEIWRMLSEPCRLGHMFELLTQRYDVDVETLTRDVTPFLRGLLEHRLVRQIDIADAS
jgi:hypothetical protein